MITHYTTSQGDTFDQIALKTLGSELLVEPILAENAEYLNTWRFDEGVVLRIPKQDEQQVAKQAYSEQLPSWRK